MFQQSKTIKGRSSLNPMLEDDIFFSNNPLYRHSERRRAENIWQKDKRNPKTRLLLLKDGAPFVKIHPQTNPDGLTNAGLLWLAPHKLPDIVMNSFEDSFEVPLFLGCDQKASPHWSLCFTGDDKMLDSLLKSADNALAGHDKKFYDLRALALQTRIPPGDLAIAAQAKAMLSWHQSHLHCACCGAMTTSKDAGYARQCCTCHRDHFPRTDPVVIMLPLYKEQALLARSPHFPKNRYSALAGFMEPGETIEEAVAREIFEEVGLKTSSVHYYASQPWPWPSSLMIACFAHVTDQNLTLDPLEIEDALWVSKATIEQALAAKCIKTDTTSKTDKAGKTGANDQPDTNAKTQQPDFDIAPPMAIAHRLLSHWVKSL